MDQQVSGHVFRAQLSPHVRVYQTPSQCCIAALIISRSLSLFNKIESCLRGRGQRS